MFGERTMVPFGGVHVTERFGGDDEPRLVIPRPLLDNAAALAARYRGALLIAETLAADLVQAGGCSSALRPTSGRTSSAPPRISAPPSSS